MESAGLRLRKIRLEKGISLEEVHKKTKIHLNVLKSIEEDSLINFNPIYIKGFLKMYCQFLGVDPKEYIAGYKEPRYALQLNSAKKDNQAHLSSPVFLSAAFIRQMRMQMKTILALLAMAALIFLLFNLGRMFSGRRILTQHKPRLTSAKAVKPERIIETNKAQKKQEVSSSRNENPSKADVPLTVWLAIHARENCLVQLKSDGKTVFYGTLMKGRSENWHAKNKIELFLGNAGVVDLEVNGKPIMHPLGKRGQSVKNITISKEGLSIAR
ncbi:MAG: helix-turn-helix domain-containing protein [bacterium]